MGQDRGETRHKLSGVPSPWSHADSLQFSQQQCYCQRGKLTLVPRGFLGVGDTGRLTIRVADLRLPPSRGQADTAWWRKALTISHIVNIDYLACRYTGTLIRQDTPGA